jgi:type II secretory ATPase GspE/PulE/Tfp pilus assembly ATPase PilB-like protein
MGKKFRRAMERSLLDCLAYRGLISQQDLDAAVEEAFSRNVDLESILLDKYRVPKADLGTALSEFYQCPYVPFDERTLIDPDLLKNLSLDYLRKNVWLPLKRQGTVLDIVINDPHDLEKGVDIRRAFPGYTIRFAVGLRRDIERYFSALSCQATGGSITEILGELVNEAGEERAAEGDRGDVDENDSAIVRLANQVIAEAYRLGASDVHIEPYPDRKETAVRFRVDGTCFTYMRVPAAYRRAVVSRFKIMANLDIAERRKPQDGKIRYKLPHAREIELRVATLPTAGGNEDVVMRLLTAKDPIPLEAMDFQPEVVAQLRTLVEKPYGIILCVGPTGSGKTTTLHALLRHINTDERKIWTAEDPIEIT